MGWGRRVVERFRTDGAPRVLVLVVVVAGLVVWDRSNDVDLRDVFAQQVRGSEQVGRYVVPLTPAQAGRFGDGKGPTNERATALSGRGNDDLEELFIEASEAGSDDGFAREMRAAHLYCRYWPVASRGGGPTERLLQMCWDSDRPRARSSSWAEAQLVRD